MIICAAIKFHIYDTDNDVILCGVRHGDCFSQLKDMGLEPGVDYKELCQGFIDNRIGFLNRKEAMKVAIESGQISTMSRWYEQDQNNIELFSEDLW